MESNYTALEKRYLVEQRVKEQIQKHGTAQKAIRYLSAELKECEDNWSEYSYDCVGHAITCIRLLIPRLEDTLTNKQ